VPGRGEGSPEGTSMIMEERNQRICEKDEF